MNIEKRSYVFLGLSITSAWGNGHATTYRGLLKALAKRGHHVSFLERDVPWYAGHREFDSLPYCDVHLYRDLDQLRDEHTPLVRSADAVIVGSYVPEGSAVGDWVYSNAANVAAFYDIDTPVTLAALAENRCEYLTKELIPRYDLYLSFTGGPTLRQIEMQWKARCARPLYCSVDPDLYYPEALPRVWDLGYLGTYAADRQPALQRLLFDVASRTPRHSYVVAGPQYPGRIAWPANVTHIEHLPAANHRHFYNSQAFALNLTRRDMIRAGYSPSVRLFEASACGVPILTDEWPGLSQFFTRETEISLVQTTEQVAQCLKMPEEMRMQMAARARCRTLRHHTACARAAEFDLHISAALEQRRALNRKQCVPMSQPSIALVEELSHETPTV